MPRGPREGGFGRGFWFDLVVLVAGAVMFVGDTVVTEAAEVAGAVIEVLVEVVVVPVVVAVVLIVDEIALVLVVMRLVVVVVVVVESHPLHVLSH